MASKDPIINPQFHSEVLRSYPAYLDGLLEGNHYACSQLLDRLIKQEAPLVDIYRGLFERSLVQIGRLWESNEISVATEHMATSLTESLMAQLYPVLFKVDRVGHSAIVSCTVNEYHQVGGKMVADLFEAHGWDSYFLGANTPLPDLIAMVQEKAPDLLCFSLALYSNTPLLKKALQQVTQTFPSMPILVGGQAFCWGGAELMESYPQVRYVASLPELETLIDTWDAQ